MPLTQTTNNYIYAKLWTRICTNLWDQLYLIPLLIIFEIIGFLLISLGLLAEDISFVIENIIYGLYFILLLSSGKQATYGMMKKNIVIIDRAGNKISFLRSTLRYLCDQIPAIAFLAILRLPIIYSDFYIILMAFLGLITLLPMLMHFHPQKQAYYDIICGTYVIHKQV